MGKRILEVAPEFLVDLCRAPGELVRSCTVDEALPEDARFVAAHVDEDAQRVLLILESAEWEETPANERLRRVRPRFTVHVEPGWEQESKDGLPPQAPRVTP